VKATRNIIISIFIFVIGIVVGYTSTRHTEISKSSFCGNGCTYQPFPRATVRTKALPAGWRRRYRRRISRE
jgi:hypothetical protein